MKFLNKEKNVELIIDEKLLKELGLIGVNHYPNEFGGFLIGNYSVDFMVLTVIGYILPTNYKGFPYVFERSTKGLKKIFNKLFIEKSQYYVGEWHTHPDGSTQYSQTDLNAMIEIGKCQTVKIKNPVLLILSVNARNLKESTFYLYDKEKLITYE